MRNIYFTSDLHLGHKNAIKHSDRPFASIDDMDNKLISNINEIAQENDILYILGDFTAYGTTMDDAINYRQKIHCQNLHLVNGNHDKNYENVECFSSVQDYLEIREKKQLYVLFHYPIASWNHMEHGAIHLHGHQHNTCEYNKEQKAKNLLRYEVGVDANNYYPVSLEHIRNWFLG